MGVVLPHEGFLQGLRELTRKNGALLIVDEVITGFRLRNGSAQKLFGIEADLTTLGKIIGGGLPVAAYGGSAVIMDRVAPLGPIYQAGTLAGNPLAMRAGIATLDQLSTPGLYEHIEELAGTLVSAIREAIHTEKIPAHVNTIGSLATLFFTQDPVNDYSDAKKSDAKKYTRYFRNMLERGVFLAPSQFEASFVSLSHNKANIDFAISAAQESLHQIAQS
jgi:glutamate-1-semialdehyde 2,1-aminomutase